MLLSSHFGVSLRTPFWTMSMYVCTVCPNGLTVQCQEHTAHRHCQVQRWRTHVQHTTCDAQLTMSVNGSTSSLQYFSSSDLKLKPPLRWTASEITERVFKHQIIYGCTKDSDCARQEGRYYVLLCTYICMYIQHVRTYVWWWPHKWLNYMSSILFASNYTQCMAYSWHFTLSMQLCCY